MLLLCCCCCRVNARCRLTASHPVRTAGRSLGARGRRVVHASVGGCRHLERAPRVLSRIVLNPISRFSSRFSYRIIPLLVRFTSFQNPHVAAPRCFHLSHLRRASDQNSNYAVRKTRRAASLAWPGGGIHSDSCVPGRPWASNGSFLRLLDFPSVCPGLLRLPLWRLLASLLVLCLALWSAATTTHSTS